MSLSGGSPVVTHITEFMSECDMDLLGVVKLPSNEVQCQSHSEMKQLSANEPVQHIICRWSCTPLARFLRSQHSAVAHRQTTVFE